MPATVMTEREADLLRALTARIDQQDPGAFNNLGALFFSKGMVREAVAAFLQALALDPRMRTAARNLEVAAARDGACDVQFAEIGQRLSINPDDVEARREQARLNRLIGRNTEAIAQLDTLIAENPDDAAALFERGLIEQRAGDLRRAQRWFERAANARAMSNDDDAIPRLHLAEVLYQRGQNEQALTGLNELLAEHPAVAEAHLLRSFVLGDMGQFAAALDASQHAVSLNPALQSLNADLSIVAGGAPDTALPAGPDTGEFAAIMSEIGNTKSGAGLARYGLGLAFRQRGYFDESRREFERALAQGEDEQLVQHALAELDLVVGRSEDACRRYASLLKTQDGQPHLWNEHGVALHQSGDVAAAASSYQRALRLDPRLALAYNNLGVALSDMGDAAAARESLNRAAELEPALLLARLNMARWMRANQDHVGALAVLREIVAFQPQAVDAWQLIGAVLFDLARYEEAREALAHAIQLRADHAEARYTLALVLATLGDDDGALRETQHALRLATMRVASRLKVGIALQHECPEAIGALDLLGTQGGEPLRGVQLREADIHELLSARNGASELAQPEAADAAGCARAQGLLIEASGFAGRALHGEACERYQQARTMLDAPGVATDAERASFWYRAALGEARSLCLLGHASEARGLLRALGAVTPHDAEVLALFAASLVDGSAPESDASTQARTALLRLFRIDVPSAALLHYAGDIAAQLGDEALALAFFRRALALDPSRPTPRVAVAQMLRVRGDLLAARLELVAALAAVPGWPAALRELASVHLDARRFGEARRLLADHLSRIPTDLAALLLMSEVLVEEARTDDAKLLLGRLLRHDPGNTGALWFQGLLYARQARHRDAIACWQKLVALPEPDRFVGLAREALTLQRAS